MADKFDGWQERMIAPVGTGPGGVVRIGPTEFYTHPCAALARPSTVKVHQYGSWRGGVCLACGTEYRVVTTDEVADREYA